MAHDKATTQHVDAIESANASDNSEQGVPIHPVNSANEEIVQHLQTTGEEVGMTFRTIMAAVVSAVGSHIRKWLLTIFEVHGHVLQRIFIYAPYPTGNFELYQC